ncbi:MAG: hypothetical protein EOM20_15115 [Spartobacteria bacterium]|nr:hypothetical protein [Spartobacteria bacterium]
MTTGKSARKTKSERNLPRAGVAARLFLSTVLTLACLAGILYGTAHLLARTEGFRGIIEEKLEDRLGYPVTIESTATDSRLNLIVAGLMTSDFNKPGQPGYGVELIVIDWSPLGLVLPDRDIVRSVRVKRANLSLALNEKGEWAPEAFAPMAMWLAQWARFDVGDKEKSAMPAVAPEQKKPVGKKAGSKEIDQQVWEQVRLELDGCGIRWWDHRGHEMASALDINLFSTPVDVPKRRLQHYRVEIGEASAVGRQEASDLVFELLATQGHHILLRFIADWRPVTTKKPVREIAKEEIVPPVVSRPAPAPTTEVYSPPPVQPVERPVPTPEPVPVVEYAETFETIEDSYTDPETDALLEEIRHALQDALPDESP